MIFKQMFKDANSVTTHLWCVNKNNLESSRDEGSGYEDEDCYAYPAPTKREDEEKLRTAPECVSQM